MRNYLPRRIAIFSLMMLTALALLAVCSGPGVVLADAIVTNCSSYGATSGLQAAIAGGGTITFQCSGTITVPEIGVSTTLTLNGNGNAVTLSGNNANRIFSVTSGGNLTLKGLTIANGYVKGADDNPIFGIGIGGDADGGGIFINGGTANLINTTVSNNRAIGGNVPTPPSFSDTLLGGDAAGGGIRVRNGTLNLSNSTITNNKAIGGNISSGATLLPGFGDGGGIAIDTNSTLTLTNTTIANNQAIGGNAGTSSTGQSFGLDGRGGGVWIADSTATLRNVTIANNQATGGTGVNFAGRGFGGGLWVFVTANASLTNSLIAKNTTTSFGPDVMNNANKISWQGYSLIGNISDAGFNGDATNLTSVDPLLDTASLKNNGGPTATVGLQATSPALDKIPVANCPTTDQRYASRSGLCDMGAFELNGTLPQLTVSPASLPDGTLNQAYNSQTFSATGGTTPYNFYVSSGSLPTGLTLSSGGLLSGTPVASGSFSFTVKVADNNNLSATTSYTIVIPDTVAPSASPNQSPAANTNGWNNSDVTVTWNWKDNQGGSGLDNTKCPASSTSGGEGSNLTLTANCTDLAGNTGTATYTVKVDKTPPTTSGPTPVEPPHSSGYYTTALDFSTHCTDTLSGVDHIASFFPPSYDGPDSNTASVTAICQDLAGNTSSNTFTFKYDSHLPTVTASATTAGGQPYTAGTWTNQNVTVRFTCTDNLSGVATCPAAQTISAEGITASVRSGEVSDLAGNRATATVSFGPIKIDRTPPVVTATPDRTPDANGWYNHPVSFTFSGNDVSGSGVVSCDAPTSYNGPDSLSAFVSGTCTDAAGNIGSATASFHYDATNPTVSYSGNAGTYTVDQTISITCNAADNLSGVASSTCANISGPAYSFALGNNSFSASTTDNAGNVGSGSTSFTLKVTFDSLCTLSANFSTDPSVDKGLCDKLAAAKAAAAAGDTMTKNNNLNAYRQQLSAQSGKALTKQQATILTNLSKVL